LSTDTELVTIPVGDGPWNIAITPDGTRAYVTNRDDNTISILDLSTDTELATISVGDGPRGIAITP
tara:strand:- start:1705 stop:1902 length:198 start_codon:yes stop_codon:yes gene_type:complete